MVEKIKTLWLYHVSRKEKGESYDKKGGIFSKHSMV